jgi:hypothetical protein
MPWIRLPEASITAVLLIGRHPQIIGH